MRGVDVYRKDDIPDEYHYKHGRYVQEILVCAKPGIRAGLWEKYIKILKNI